MRVFYREKRFMMVKNVYFLPFYAFMVAVVAVAGIGCLAGGFSLLDQ